MKTRTPRQSIDAESSEYAKGVSCRAKGGDRSDNPYKGAGFRVRQWVNWQAGFLGIERAE